MTNWNNKHMFELKIKCQAQCPIASKKKFRRRLERLFEYFIVVFNQILYDYKKQVLFKFEHSVL